MGNRGPVGKRDDERIRRNKPDVETETVEMDGSVKIPPLGLDDPHPIITDFYNSLTESGQARYYEPSDWQIARWVSHYMDKLIKSERPSSQMLVAINSMLSNLLVTEGDRRRVRMEIEREQQKTTAANVANIADYFREQLAK